MLVYKHSTQILLNLKRRGSHEKIDHYIKRLKMLGIIILVLLVLLVVAAIPSWPYSRSWGYYPSGIIGLIFIIILILVLTGRIT